MIKSLKTKNMILLITDFNVKAVHMIFKKRIFALFATKTKQENGLLVRINSVKDGFTIIVINI